jgi:hypothetical protein
VTDRGRFEESVRAVRAAIVLAELRTHGEAFETAADVARMPRFALWDPLVVEETLADLAADGEISESADGRLCVRPKDAA